jgi:septal ring factor EnvC (AmiA/AmiB activator)
MRASTLLTCVLAVCTFTGAILPVLAQEREPLNNNEIDELREAAQEPVKRLRLYVTFSGSRLIDIDSLQGKNSVADRGQQIHDLLQDFSTLIDEMDDNIDEYARRAQDMRKVLPEVIKAETDYQTRLRTLQQTATNDPKAAEELRAYNFALQDAMEAVRGSLDDAQKTLADQNEQFRELEEKQKQEKKKKKY